MAEMKREDLLRGPVHMAAAAARMQLERVVNELRPGNQRAVVEMLHRRGMTLKGVQEGIRRASMRDG